MTNKGNLLDEGLSVIMNEVSPMDIREFYKTKAINILGVCRIYDDAELPIKTTNEASCFDVKAYINCGVREYFSIDENNNNQKINSLSGDERSIILQAKSRMIVPTGLKLDIPTGFDIHVFSRSGLPIKSGIMVMNGVGVVDTDYKGELGVILYNSTNRDFVIKHGDRIAQISMTEKIAVAIIDVPVKAYDTKSERDASGFGSSGM